MSINDLRFRTKSLIPLGIMALTVIGMVAFGSDRLFSVSATATAIIEKRDRAAEDIARAERLIVQIPYAVDATVLNADNSPAELAAAKDFKESPQAAEALLQEAETLLPDRAGEIVKLGDRLSALMRTANAAYQAGTGFP